MEIGTFFNALLISLSLATVLLTFASYIIYKVKSLPQKISPTDKNDGIFFKRLFPETITGELEQKRKAEEAERGEKPKFFLWRWLSRVSGLGAFFTVILVVIFVSIVVADLVADRHGTLEVQAKHRFYLTLKEQGMLAEHELTRFSSEGVLNEQITNPEVGRTRVLLESLKNVRIVLVALDDSKANSSARITGLDRWKNTLGTLGLKYKSVSNLNFDKSSVDVAILPQASELSATNRSQIDRLIKGGVSLLVSGIHDSNAEWLDQSFGVKVDKVEEPVSDKVSLVFSSPTNVLIDIPPGYVLRDKPLDRAKVTVGEKASCAGYLASPLGHLKNFNCILAVKDHEESKTAWFGFDPNITAATSAPDRIRQAMLVGGYIRWLASLPSAQIAPWKKHKSSAVLLSVVGTEDYDYIGDLVKIFKENQFPATLFLNAAVLNRIESFSNYFYDDLEIASNGQSNRRIDELPLKDQFNEIQESRYHLELTTQKRVAGFYPVEGYYDNDLVVAAAENRLSYFVTDDQNPRYSPILADDGRVVLFPRMFSDTLKKQQRYEYATVEQLQEILDSEMKITSRLNGMYQLMFDYRSFQSSRLKRKLGAYLSDISKQDVWTATYSEVAKWFKERSRIEVVVSGAEVTVNNLGANDIRDVPLFIETGTKKGVLKKTIPLLRAAESVTVKAME